jgi:hypothetical protein
VKAEIDDPGFKPYTIKITFETHKEELAFYSLFNFSPVCEVISKYGIDDEKLRKLIKDIKGYNPIHEELCNIQNP